MIPPLISKQEVGIWRVKKRFPRYGVPIWSLWPNIRFLRSIVVEKNATKNEHICSMCIKINKVGKQEVGIWRVQKRYPQYGIPWKINLNLLCMLPPLSGEPLLQRIFIHYWSVVYIYYVFITLYLYEACDQISDSCHQQLLRKMRRKISWTDGRTDRRTEVKQYTPSPFGERGYNYNVGNLC